MSVGLPGSSKLCGSLLQTEILQTMISTHSIKSILFRAAMLV